MKSDPPRLLVSNEEGGKELKKGQVRLTAWDLAELSGREEMSENRLRTGQNRFLLHKSYSEKCD